MGLNTSDVPYVLITPAWNEERFIEKTLQSVVEQTLLPVKWVIVNDGSTDATGSIIERFAAPYDWIEVVNLPKKAGRNFAAKVNAFNVGKERLKGVAYEVIGNLDADVSLDKEQFAFLMSKFREDPELGVAGTIFKEHRYSSATDSFEGQNHVAGACQMFRRRCFDEIGGYFPSKVGGIDWIAVTTARMIGWKTRSFREKPFFHHRTLGTADRGVLRSNYTYGEKDYYMGGHPLWEIFRCSYRIFKKPYLLGGLALFLGYFGAALRREKRPVTDELMKFHRNEQMQKLKRILVSVCTLKRVNGFELLPIKPTTRTAANPK